MCSRAADGVAGGAGRRGAWRHGWRGRDRSETMACMHAIVSPATPFSETNACMHAIVSLGGSPAASDAPAPIEPDLRGGSACAAPSCTPR